MDPPGEAKPDQEIIARIFLKVRELYEQEGGTFPEPVRNLNWWYSNPASPSLDEVCKEINGWAIEDVRDPAGAVVVRAGQQLSRFLDTRADGSTLSGNWLYIGMYTDAGNLTQRRSYADPSGLGRYPEWTFSWPANRRILYNRCSADAQGRPWDPSRVGIAWNGQRWVGDTPDYTADSAPDAGLGAFIMLPEGVARLFVPGQFVEGPWSEHYEPAESPVANPLHPDAQLESGGASRSPPSSTCSAQPTSFRSSARPTGSPSTSTTGRRTIPYNVQLQPEFFVEIPEELAREKGIANGDHVRVTSARGSIEGRAMVTRRIKPMQVAGKTVVSDRLPDPLGLPRPRPAARLAGQPRDADRRRSEFVRAGVQGLPREAGEGVKVPRPSNFVRVSATTPPAPGVRVAADGRQAHRHLDLHRLQGLRGGLPGVERSAAGNHRCRWARIRRCPT